MQHVFLDTENFGSPGHGRVFAVGAVHFDDSGILGRAQFIFRQQDPQCGTGHLRWLLGQPDIVRQQAMLALDGHDSALPGWEAFIVWVMACDEQVMVWADDYSDFAMLEAEARLRQRPTLRELTVCQVDSTAIIELASPVEVDTAPFHLTPHVAIDDATFGALQLLAALRKLGCKLPTRAAELGGP